MSNYIFPFLWMRGEPEVIIRREIGKIYDCGIRAVCVEARPHDDFCGPGWWHDMDIVLDEAKKRGMKVWILDDKHFPTGYAAGLIAEKYPERKKWYLAETTLDVYGGKYARTIPLSRMLKPVIGYWEIGKPANEEERKNNCLIAVTALRFTDIDTFAEDTVDLTDICTSAPNASFILPEGQWRIHVIYKTRTDGGNEDYINMLDRVSAATQIEGVYESHYLHYKDEFGKTIAGFFSDEPALGNTSENAFDTKVGKKGMPLPWSDELEGILKERYGNDFRRRLPFLFADSEEKKLCPETRYDYMNAVSRLYERNFSVPIGEWCRERGVEYIGHVVEDNSVHSRTGLGAGHYFRAMTGQDMAGIDVIGSQVFFGAPFELRRGMANMDEDGEFFHYALGKMGASCGHLDPKKKGRTMCELFGAYGWNFGVRDMRYLLDHLLVRGVNHLVPHAFSMAEYPDPDCPPHFYAGGNNGQYAWFAELMRYANRMCDCLNGGTHISSAAVLYDGEQDWPGNRIPMQKIGRALAENQIEFDVVPLDILRDLPRWNGKLDGSRLEINGVSFDVLVIPHSEYIPAELADFICRNKEFAVWFAGGFPDKVLRGEDGLDRDDSYKTFSLEVTLEDIPAKIRGNGSGKVRIEPASDSITLYHYRKDAQIFMLMNESAEKAYQGKILLPVQDELIVYDGDHGRYLSLDSKKTDAGREAELALMPGESLLLMEKTGRETEGRYLSSCRILTEESVLLDLSEGWKTEICVPKEYPEGFKPLDMKKPVPVSDLLPDFSGIIRYTREFTLEDIPEVVHFSAENVFEVMRIRVNGRSAGVKLTPPYLADISGMLIKGSNTIEAEIANTPGRDQNNHPRPPFDFLHEALEPSGMFGKISLIGEK